MRQSRENQPSFTLHLSGHRHARELEQISRILEQNPTLAEQVLQDLGANLERGAPGMSGDQILRCAIVKKMEGLSYDGLAFALEDSLSLRDFCRFSFAAAPGRSTLAENISRVGWKIWKKINDAVVRWAAAEKLEKGRKARIDATPVKCRIAHPTDNRLLYDCVRVLTGLLRALSMSLDFQWVDHTRSAKKRCMKIVNSRRQSRRVGPYRDLLGLARRTRSYVEAARQAAQVETLLHPSVASLVEKLEHFSALTDRVIDQTQRRVFGGESVPASEKVVSIFEDHADILRKGSRETVYGHKMFLTCGASSLILDCRLERGNPADSNLLQPMLERQNDLYGRYPRQVATDGGFASRANLDWAKQAGVKDVAFSKKCTFKVEEMAKSSWVYRQLKKFRAGIEGCISHFKRSFGGDCCDWKGWLRFQQYVHLSVVAYNLLALARMML